MRHVSPPRSAAPPRPIRLELPGTNSRPRRGVRGWFVPVTVQVGLVCGLIALVWAGLRATAPEPVTGAETVATATPAPAAEPNADPAPFRDPLIRASAATPAAAPAIEPAAVAAVESQAADAADPLGVEMARVDTPAPAAAAAEAAHRGEPRAVEAPVDPPAEDRPAMDPPRFFGQPVEGERIVFVIDGSGSLLDTLPFAVAELRAVFDQLRPPAGTTEPAAPPQINVIFFQGDRVIEALPRRLEPATPAVLARLDAWVNTIQPKGATRPLPALERALSYRPDTIVLLTDAATGRGRYRIEPETLAKAVLAHNRGNTRVDTFHLGQGDSLEQARQRAAMQLLAEHTGGTYTHVSLDRVRQAFIAAAEDARRPKIDF